MLGRPFSPTGMHHGVFYPCGAITLALRWRRRSRPEWLSTVCRRHRYRLVLGSPRAHPSWTSRNRSIRSCGQSELSRRKQRQLPRPLPLLTSCQSLQWMARCCHQHPLTGQSTLSGTAGIGRVPCSVQHLSWSYNITSSSRSCGGIGRTSAMLSSPQELTRC